MAKGSMKMAWTLVICELFRRTMQRYRSLATTVIINDTMKTKVVGAVREILHSQSVWSPHGQYLLRASTADKGMVAAKAKSVTAKWKIKRLRGVRT